MTRKAVLAIVLGMLLLSVAGAVPPQGSSEYDLLKAQAEKEYAEKSFRRAHEVYAQAAKLTLSDEDKRWVAFRLADTTWRNDAAAPNADRTETDAAVRALAALARVDGAEVRDLVFAEANESLGDYYRFHPFHQNVQEAQRYYTEALDWWAGSSDLDVARRRYLAMVWKLVHYESPNWIPRHVLSNAIQIADTVEDRTHAQYLLGAQLASQGSVEGRERALELFDAIIAQGRKSSWYDDALAYSAGIHASPGGDYKEALRRYRRLLAEFAAGETKHRRGAERAIAAIVDPSVQLFVHGTFLPESEQELDLRWRNVAKIELSLTPVDLTRDVAQTERRNWIESIDSTKSRAVRTWTYDTKDKGDHEPGSDRIRITPKVAPGAYVLAARGGTESAKTLLLVTDTHIITHAARSRMAVYVSSVKTGAPVPNARVYVSQQVERRFVEYTGQTDANGLATIDVGDAHGQVLVTAAAGNERQAFLTTYGRGYGYGSRSTVPVWRSYVFTDRPAYRPGETVQWKAIVRRQVGETWSTPDGETLDYQITDPRGQKVAEGKATFNAFGSFWSELPLTASMPLGQYHIHFQTKERSHGASLLFRLEEYKLPEFRVDVSTPVGTQYRLGETIEATIDATYYFGGPVANATVEAVVYQQPFHRYWYPWRTYDWYFQDQRQQYHGETVIKTETLRTDANGRAVLRIETPRDGSDMSYRIEARVVDASRREVRGQGNARVTRQRYTVLAHPEHFIHRPGESVSVDFKALDANDQPVRTTGTVTVVRRYWQARFVDRAGERIDRSRHEEELISEQQLATNEAGEATFTFTPKREGHYVIRWQSPEGPKSSSMVRAETAVWVADRATTDFSHRSDSGLNLIVDRETMRAGGTATMMLVAPASGRWVLLSTSSEELLDVQVVKLDGTAKLVELRLDERHVPNFFVTASSIFERQFSNDQERIVVPPVKHFLTVDVKADREQYQPREEGTITVTTKDVDGKPVAAEVALSVSDEAVTAIQQDPAGDPRQFFYSITRPMMLQVAAGVQTQQYLDLVERVEEAKEEEGRVEGQAASVGGVEGGRFDAVQEVQMAPPPAPAAPPPPPVAESITVTSQAPERRLSVQATANTAATDAASDGEIDVQVRSDFRSTAFWKPDLVTDASGTATVKMRFPEALTTWRATARAATTGMDFGMGTSTARTHMPLIVRLQGPRFFVAGDRVVISAVVNNNTNEAVTVTPTLEVEGLRLEQAAAEPLQIAANGEARADWNVVAEAAGPAKLRVAAKSSKHGDAMERTFLVYEHGIDKLIARSGKLRGSEALVRLDLPRERRATELTVQVAPSLAVAMLDALPYLLEFPYGCTEQTMSRFLPAAIVARTLEKLGLDPEARLPKKRLQEVTAAGMARLYDMQHDDGGWGWWKEGSSDDFMTAYVVWGFAVAREGGLPVRANAVDRGAAWLEQRLAANEREPNDLAWMLHALSAWREKPSTNERRAFDNVWKNRERLTAYSRALAALTAHRWNETERAQTFVRNLEDGVQVDSKPDQSVLLKGAGESAAETMATAHWGASNRFWWRWYDSPVETTAFVLQALVTIDPQHRLIEPAMNWLVKNRRGAQWSNTRDTAIALLALNDYLERSRELSGDVGYELSVNGRVIATKTLTPAEVLGAPSRFTIDPAALGEARQEVHIRRTSGSAPIYFAAEARFVSLEEPVKAAGNELFVKREYFRLKPRPTLLKGVQYDRVPLGDNETVNSGDRIEVLATIETKNDYSYLIFEDLKPAGLEAVELQSGQSLFAQRLNNSGSVFVYQELRDRKVAMFIDHLPQGIWQIRYTLRAEVPGTYHALPLLGQAMYVPEIRANGEEVRVGVR